MLREIVQANFVSLAGLLFLSVFLRFNSLFQKRQSRLFIIAVVFNMCLLIITSLDYAFANSGPNFYVLRRITSCLNFAGGPLIPLLLCLIFSEKKLKLIAYLPLVFNLALCFASMFKPFVFFITTFSTYNRGPLFFVPMTVSIFYLIMMIAQPVKHIYSKHAERVFLLFVILFMVLSVVAEVIISCQFINYNTSAVSLILYYLILTIQSNITDPLTGTYNRAMYQHEMQNMKKKGSYVLAMLDLNNFKIINDRFGHSNGDRCLVALATLLMQQLPNTKVYRIGGDEFIITFKNQEPSQVSDKLKEVRALLNENKLDFAYGIASYTPNQDIQDVITQIDKNMYEDKKNSKALSLIEEEIINL